MILLKKNYTTSRIASIIGVSERTVLKVKSSMPDNATAVDKT
jgi:DNA-binding CsgD family transcriptional regulator